MDNGNKSEVLDLSAAAAIQSALKQHPGQRVVKCHSGLTKQEAVDMRKAGFSTAMEGFINHEIPAHEPLTEEQASAKRAKKTDDTLAMFDDAAIKAESKTALEKAEYQAVFQ